MDIFCKIINQEIPSKTLYEDETVKVILDVSPKHPGHTLIIPKNHYLDLHDIDIDVLTHIMETAKSISKLLEKKLNPHSIVLVQNNGQEEEVKHYHLHLIPIYNKDPNLNTDEIYNILTK
jgi:histidine triad (HIT) family protein